MYEPINHEVDQDWEQALYAAFVREPAPENLWVSVEQRLFDARDRGDLFVETIFVASRANARWLLEDAPDFKRRQVDEALRRWGRCSSLRRPRDVRHAARAPARSP